MESCIFCQIIKKETPATIIDEDTQTITFLDIRPLFPGHCLVVPKSHIITLPEMPDDAIPYLYKKVKQVATIIPQALGSQGTFIATNNIVSQSVPHLHVHVVPRTIGDGLKGFFWPRKGYEDESHKQEVAQKLRTQLSQL